MLYLQSERYEIRPQNPNRSTFYLHSCINQRCNSLIKLDILIQYIYGYELRRNIRIRGIYTSYIECVVDWQRKTTI